MNVKRLIDCGRSTRDCADSGADFIGFINRVPRYEFYHRGGGTYVREYGDTRLVPLHRIADTEMNIQSLRDWMKTE